MGAYAAGVLTGPAEAVVRDHLADGCRECLEALFGLPVGLPRRAAGTSRDPAAWRVVAAVAVVVALTGTVLVSGFWLGGQARPAADPQEMAGVRALTYRAAAAGERLVALGRRSTGLAARLEAVGDASRAWSPGQRTSPLDRAQRPLAALASSLLSTSTHVEAMRPTVSAGGARGWLAWDALRGRLFVYSAGLPPVRRPWEAWVTLGTETRRFALRRLSEGSLWSDVVLGDRDGCLAAVSVVSPEEGRAVLVGDVPVCPSPPA